MIKVEVKGTATLLAKLDGIRGGLSKGEMGKVYTSLANEESNLIKTGTLAGRDITGKAFTSLKFRAGMPLADTGKMLAAVHAMSLGPAGAAVVIGNVADAKKGVYHQFGTGIYGPTHRRITPRGRALGPMKTIGTTKGGNVKRGKVFYRSVAGVPPRPWFGFRAGDIEKLTEKVKIYIDTILGKATG